MQEQPAKPRPGRPFKFRDVQGLKQLVDNYFSSCDPHLEERLVEAGIDQKGYTIWAKRNVMTEPRPYTTTGLARALGTSRQTLLDYESPEHYSTDIPEDVREELIDTVADAKARCHEYAEEKLYSAFANGAKFNLINNHGWEDRTVRENKGGLFGDTEKIELEVVPHQPNAADAEDNAAAENTNEPDAPADPERDSESSPPATE